MGLNLIYKTIQYSKSTDSQKCLWQSTGIAAIMDLLQYDQLDSTRNPGNSCSKWPFHWSYDDNLWKLWGCYYVNLCYPKFSDKPISNVPQITRNLIMSNKILQHPSTTWVWVKIRYPNTCMVNAKLD